MIYLVSISKFLDILTVFSWYSLRHFLGINTLKHKYSKTLLLAPQADIPACSTGKNRNNSLLKPSQTLSLPSKN